LLDSNQRVQRFVPDLAVEIASARETYDDMLRKKDRYRRAGTLEVWLISTSVKEIAFTRPQEQRFLVRATQYRARYLLGFSVTDSA
jgi:Uma2 family endonuclease